MIIEKKNLIIAGNDIPVINRVQGVLEHVFNYHAIPLSMHDLGRPELLIREIIRECPTPLLTGKMALVYPKYIASQDSLLYKFVQYLNKNEYFNYIYVVNHNQYTKELNHFYVDPKSTTDSIFREILQKYPEINIYTPTQVLSLFVLNDVDG